MATANPYYDYYVHQMGSGDYYRSHIAVQRGKGWLGNLLRSAWSYLKPVATSAAKHVGREMLSTGANIVRDSLDNPDQRLSDILKTRGKEGLVKLRERTPDILAGRGRRPKARKRLARQTPVRRRVRRTPRKQTAAIRDIFSPVSP